MLLQESQLVIDLSLPGLEVVEMTGTRHFLLYGVIALCLTCTACAPVRYTTRPQTFNTQLLESALRRGTSTMSDVERLLGKADGIGEMLLPADTEPKTAWIYEKIELENYRGQMTVLQDILLVFFKGNIFDGFLWFSDAPGSWRKEASP